MAGEACGAALQGGTVPAARARKPEVKPERGSWVSLPPGSKAPSGWLRELREPGPRLLLRGFRNLLEAGTVVSSYGRE